MNGILPDVCATVIIYMSGGTVSLSQFLSTRFCLWISDVLSLSAVLFFHFFVLVFCCMFSFQYGRLNFAHTHKNHFNSPCPCLPGLAFQYPSICEKTFVDRFSSNFYVQDDLMLRI